MPLIILLTHEHIGPCLLQTAESIISERADAVLCIEVPMDSDPEMTIDEAHRAIAEHDETLILTDLYGSTPANIASKIANSDNVDAVCGLNLPMLLRVLNYRTEPLSSLTQKAVDGAKSGIKSC